MGKPKLNGHENGNRLSKRQLKAVLSNATNKQIALGMLAAGDTTVPVLASPKTTSDITTERIVIAKRGQWNSLRGLTPELLTWKLDSFRQGYLWDAALTWWLMIARDPMVKGSVMKRVKAPARHGYEIVMDEDSDEALAQKAVLEYCFAHLRTQDAMDQDKVGGFASAIRQMMLAHAYYYQSHEMVWRPMPNAIKLTKEDPQTDGSSKTVEIGVMDGLTLTLHALPLWFFENITGKLRYLRQFGQLYGVPMEEGGWMVTCGDGLMEATSVAYAYKNLFALKNWAAMAELWGDPKVYGRTSSAVGSDSYNTVVETVQAIGNGVRTVMSGSKDDVEILTLEATRAAGAGESVYKALIDYCDTCIITLWRGGDLSTLSGGGGQQGESGTVGASVQGEESNILETDDCDMLEEVLNEYIVRWCIRYQFGEGVEPLCKVVIARPDRKNTKLDLEVDKFLTDGGAKQKNRDVAGRYDRTVQNPEDDFTSLQRDQMEQQAAQAEAQAAAQEEAAKAKAEQDALQQRQPAKPGEEEVVDEEQQALSNAEQDKADAKEFASVLTADVLDKLKAKYGDLIAKMDAMKAMDDEAFSTAYKEIKPDLEAMVKDLPNFLPKHPQAAEFFKGMLTENVARGVKRGVVKTVKRKLPLTNDDMPVSCKAIITDSDGRVLLLKDSRSEFWDLPGGHMDEGETIYEAVKREVKEETGLDLGALQDGESAQLELGGTPRTVIFFDCIAPDDVDVKLSHEHSGHVWATPEDAAALNTGVFKPFITKEVPQGRHFSATELRASTKRRAEEAAGRTLTDDEVKQWAEKELQRIREEQEAVLA